MRNPYEPSAQRRLLTIQPSWFEVGQDSDSKFSPLGLLREIFGSAVVESWTKAEIQTQFERLIVAMAQTLNDQDYYILATHFGLNHDPYADRPTAREIAIGVGFRLENHGVQVTQREKRAIKKLRKILNQNN